MGGYHWLRIASSPPLIVYFMVCGVLLPVVSLHFYFVFPRPKPLLVRYPRLSVTALYGLPGLFLVAILAGYFWTLLAFRLGSDPIQVERASQFLLYTIFGYLLLAAVLFFGCVVSLLHSFVTTPVGSPERNQVKWIFTGAVLASGPIGYTFYLAVADPDRFAIGGATWPMFAASLCFTLAYGVSISRYGLMGVEQVLNRGLVYALLSVMAGLAYYLLIFLGTLLGSQLQPQSPVWQATWVSTISLVLLVLLDLFRWRIRAALDRRLFRAQHQLDRTLQRMSQAVEQLVDPPTLSKRLLHALAELLDFQQGSVYLRAGDGDPFRLAAHIGPVPERGQLAVTSPLVQALEQSPLVRKRTTTDRDAVQAELEALGGEVAVAVKHERRLMAVLLVGTPLAGRYDIEDLHLFTSFAQVAALALHSARGHQMIEQLNQELRAKVEKISEQQRRIVALQNQLMRQGDQRPEFQATGSEPVVAGGIVGSSPAIRHLIQVVRKVATSSSAVLIRGESGTGKELLARAIHAASPRAARPFVKVHCAALSPGLLESELFGHVKGAFTGAHRDKVGRFEMADGGTLFLDEIGDISPEVQTKLLRVLQEMTFERVGSSEPVRVDVRIIAATHQDLERLMQEGRFREDLFYRLNVITIRTPPLRERSEDIYELAYHFLAHYARRTGKALTAIDDEALQILKAYSWPGNVRELENVIERAVVLAESDTITVADLPVEIVRAVEWSRTTVPAAGMEHLPGAQEPPECAWRRRRAEEERERLLRALTAAGGNKARAAKLLGIPRSTFLSRLAKHGLLHKKDLP